MLAQGFQVTLQGNKQQGMGGTGTALIQDGASLFYNPGGVSFLKENGFSIGVSPVLSHSKFLDASSGTISETHSPVSTPFTGYIVLGKKDSRLKYGFAAYTPFGSTIDWNAGWTGRFVLTHLQLSSIYLQPTASYRLSDKVGIGAGFIYGIGKVNLQRDLPLQDSKGNYGKAELDGSAKGYGFNAGIYYKPSEILSFGLTYHSQVNMKLNQGTATFTVPASLSSSFPSGGFSTTLSLPKEISFGTAYAASKKLTLAMDVSMIGWHSFDTLAFYYAKKTSQLQDTKSPRNYKDVFSYRIGGQYILTENLVARLGLKYLTTPVKDGYVSPEVPDASHFNYSIGLGYKVNTRFTLDASLIVEKMNRRDTNTESQLSGTYHTNLVIPGISINYKF
ncbi:MAG: outer membrane protein transport protein [Flavisolibacter sp.]